MAGFPPNRTSSRNHAQRTMVDRPEPEDGKLRGLVAASPNQPLAETAENLARAKEFHAAAAVGTSRDWGVVIR